MREIFEFRIEESLASTTTLACHGEIIGGWIRVIKVERSDPLFQKIGQLQFRMKNNAKPLFLSWRVKREYSREEQEKAELFLLSAVNSFEPCGEQCGSEYNEKSACPHCGAGATLKTALILERSSLNDKDIARTIANEWIVSQKIVDIIVESGLTGCEFKPIFKKGRNNQLEEVAGWFQLNVIGDPIDLNPETQFGIDPFDPDIEGKFKCPLGHKYGLNLLSEVSIRRETWDKTDIARSVGFIGDRCGLLRPTPLFFISPRFRKLLLEKKIKGFTTEIVYLSLYQA